MALPGRRARLDRRGFRNQVSSAGSTEAFRADRMAHPRRPPASSRLEDVVAQASLRFEAPAGWPDERRPVTRRPSTTLDHHHHHPPRSTAQPTKVTMQHRLRPAMPVTTPPNQAWNCNNRPRPINTRRVVPRPSTRHRRGLLHHMSRMGSISR